MTPHANRARARTTGWVLVLALLFTVASAIKPLHIDDTFTLRVAEQIQRTPTDPYGFDIFWLQWPQPVHEELTPPVLPYWLALGITFVGPQPVLLKLWLFPFALLLGLALASLARRLAPGLELFTVALVLFSPAFLPAFNLMQDVPSIALGLSGLVLYLRAADRVSYRWALAAGVLTGLATQTKYTAVAMLGAMLVHAVLHRRVPQAVVSIAVSLALFFSWEAFLTAQYGHGMFLGQVDNRMFWYARSAMLVPLLRLLGATLPAVALLGLSALGLPRPAVLAAAASLLGALAALSRHAFETSLYGLLGILVFSTMLGAVWLLRPGRLRFHRLMPRVPRPLDSFLILWCATELGVFFLAAPFPAVRRVMGLCVVLTLLIMRVAALAQRKRGRPATWEVLLGVSVLLGAGYGYVDLLEARAQRDGAAKAHARIRAIDPDPPIWYVGHWGFQYYAEELGMQALNPDHSRVEAGDWLVVPSPVDSQSVDLRGFERKEELLFDSFPPMRTNQGYYAGSLPLRPYTRGARLRVELYKATRDLVPESAWPPRLLSNWALRSGPETAEAAVPALQRTLRQSDRDGRGLAARALASVSRDDVTRKLLIEALTDPAGEVRYWSVVGLGRMGDSERVRALAGDPDPQVRAAVAEVLAASP